MVLFTERGAPKKIQDSGEGYKLDLGHVEFMFLSDNLGGIIEQAVKQERYRRKKIPEIF